MVPNPKADYSLRYDKYGVEIETNNISPLLTAPDYSTDELDERLRVKFPIIREAVRIARTYKYDTDINVKFGIQIIVYHDYHECLGLTELMLLFGRASLVAVDKVDFGKTLKITAYYLIEPKEDAEEK